MRRSVVAVGLGVLLALAIGALVTVGILAPVLSAFFGLEVRRSNAVPVILPLLAFVAAFSFYFGGMAAGYKAPTRRLLHGALVAPAAFVLSIAINVLTGEGLFPGVETTPAALLAVAFLGLSAAASYVGARRGEALYAHNTRVTRRRPRHSPRS